MQVEVERRCVVLSLKPREFLSGAAGRNWAQALEGGSHERVLHYISPLLLKSLANADRWRENTHRSLAEGIHQCKVKQSSSTHAVHIYQVPHQGRHSGKNLTNMRIPKPQYSNPITRGTPQSTPLHYLYTRINEQEVMMKHVIAIYYTRCTHVQRSRYNPITHGELPNLRRASTLIQATTNQK